MDRRIDGGELFTRRHQERPGGPVTPDVLVGEDRLEAVPALAEEHRILAARLAPGDEGVAGVGRRIEVPAVVRDGRGERPSGSSGRASRSYGGSAREQRAPAEESPLLSAHG